LLPFSGSFPKGATRFYPGAQKTFRSPWQAFRLQLRASIASANRSAFTLSQSLTTPFADPFVGLAPYSGIVHPLSGPNGYALTRIHQKKIRIGRWCGPGGISSPGFPPRHACARLRFRSAPRVFSARVLAYTLDSLVRVTRRVGRDHFVNIARRRLWTPPPPCPAVREALFFTVPPGGRTCDERYPAPKSTCLELPRSRERYRLHGSVTARRTLLTFPMAFTPSTEPMLTPRCRGENPGRRRHRRNTRPRPRRPQLMYPGEPPPSG